MCPYGEMILENAQLINVYEEFVAMMVLNDDHTACETKYFWGRTTLLYGIQVSRPIPKGWTAGEPEPTDRIYRQAYESVRHYVRYQHRTMQSTGEPCR